ncbi:MULTISPECIES: FtsX-like permease family protein [Exiguobacterium]|uniref:FtsX-like permease family protein n=1 Tax=Exiguobacterium TaxID=33986 RepID=UPI001BE65D30|nr:MULTISPECIES: ABC transporter permease [Exiguobacterium]MCT4781684.1 ABC transporter permease [Exiguobacterium himgiriensis]
MTLFDLAKKNVVRNLSRYALYVGTTIFSIIIYFTFATLKHSGEISALAETSKQIGGLMNASTFILLLFVALFIAYSNAFFLKGRKREVGLYSLLGVRKKQIGQLLLFENLVIGAVSLMIGIGLGVLGANALLQVLLRLMNSDLAIGFTFSQSAFIETFVVFLGIFLFTSFQGYRVIYRFNLIELFHADQKGEDMPRANVFAAMGGVLTLGIAYWLALQDLTSPIWRVLSLAMPLVIIGLTVIGSALLFHSVLIFILGRIKANEAWSWRRLNLLTTSQLLYRIRGNAKTLTLISIISATAITAGGAIFSLYYYAEENVTSFTPYTFAWEGDAQPIDAEVLAEASVLKKTVRIPDEYEEREYGVIKESTYRELVKGLDWDEPNALDGKEVRLIDPFYDERFNEEVHQVVVDGTTYPVKEHVEKTPLNVMTFGGIFLVTRDDVYEEIESDAISYHVVKVADYKDQATLSDALSTQPQFSSATDLYRDTMAVNGALLFVGSFLGLVFLVATGSIIYFKTMTEVEEDRAKYTVLRKVGISKRDMKQTIRHQVAVVFLAPYLLGLLHASVALIAFSRLFAMNFTVPVIVWMAVYSTIYALYYGLTVRRFTKSVL